MMLPKISPEVCDNVFHEATRGNPSKILQYSEDKALELNKENPALSTIIHALSLQISGGDKELYGRIYFALLVVVNVINTQIEVDDLRNSWN